MTPRYASALPLLLAALGALLLAGVLTGPAVAQAVNDLRDGVDVIAAAGEEVEHAVDHEVSTIPGRLDLAMVFDASYSFDEDMPEIRSGVPNLVGRLGDGTDLRIAVASFIDHPAWGGSPDNYPYRLHTPAFTRERDELDAALAGISASTSTDDPETWATALDGVLTDLDWDDDATRAIVLATDAETKHRGDGWSGSDASTPEELVEELRPRGIRLIALLPSQHTAWDAERIARATGGTTQWIASDSSNLEQAITAGISNIPVALTPELGGATCPARNVRVTPTHTRPLTAGTHVHIRVQFEIASHAPPGIYHCALATGDGTHTIVVRVDAGDGPVRPASDGGSTR